MSPQALAVRQWLRALVLSFLVVRRKHPRGVKPSWCCSNPSTTSPPTMPCHDHGLYGSHNWRGVCWSLSPRALVVRGLRRHCMAVSCRPGGNPPPQLQALHVLLEPVNHQPSNDTMPPQRAVWFQELMRSIGWHIPRVSEHIRGVTSDTAAAVTKGGWLQGRAPPTPETQGLNLFRDSHCSSTGNRHKVSKLPLHSSTVAVWRRRGSRLSTRQPTLDPGSYQGTYPFSFPLSNI